MSYRLPAALLAVTTIGASAAVLAAGDDHSQEAARTQREIAREVRAIVREAIRDARYDARFMVRDIAREVHAATAWVWDDDAWQSDRAERRREQAERRREAAERRRERMQARRDEAARQRDERRFRQVSPTDDPCARERENDRRGHACEVRDTRLPAPVTPLSVDASPNGGIRVEGWDQPDVLVRAVVRTWAEDDAAAQAMLSQVQVTAAGTQVSAQGPDRDGSRRRSGWSVSFRIWAPRQTPLALTARNGGVSLHGTRGESRFTTTNGGVTLDEVGGRVVGSTRNGGVTVRLAGNRWEGEGLDVETTNGGVSLAIPSGYSAQLEASTVNGGFRTDYPLTVSGRIDRDVRATLGSGGPLLKVTTTNGGVRILQR